MPEREFRGIEEPDRIVYAGVMEQIKDRVARVGALEKSLSHPALTYCALELRLAIEEVVLSSLITSRQALNRTADALRSKDMAAARKLATAANPDYWPRGTEPVTKPDGGTEFVDRTDVLTEERYLKTWGRLSTLLHGRSPYAPGLDLGDEARFVRDTRDRLVNTLNHHVVHLAGKDEILVCTVYSEPVRVYGFGLVDN